ncbi:hypothetical protein [Brucella intermedia]|uniref:hypothetical protein n=1 Tax=Brucella intermedia TaxID=94625 RepID=UPI00158978ED|nr:hypothetical protein [Brucella intermedia]
MALRRGFHFLRGSRIFATQQITEMDQMGSRNRLAALRDDFGCGWHLPGSRSRYPAMSTRRVGRPYQFSRLSGLSVSSSSLTVPFKHRSLALCRSGYGSTHSWKDEQGVVIQGQEYVAV